MLEKNLAPYILLLLVSVVSLVAHSGTQEALNRANKQISILSDDVRQYSLERAVDRETPQPVRAEILEPIQLDAYERIAFSLNVGQRTNITWLSCGVPPTFGLELQSVSSSHGQGEASLLINNKPIYLKVASPVIVDGSYGTLELISVQDSSTEHTTNSFLWTFDCGEVGP